MGLVSQPLGWCILHERILGSLSTRISLLGDGSYVGRGAQGHARFLYDRYDWENIGMEFWNGTIYPGDERGSPSVFMMHSI